MLVVLKPKEGRAKKLKGEQALAVVEAVKMVLEKLEASMTIFEDGVAFTDPIAPKGFSYVKAVAAALALGYKTKEEIAIYIQKNRTSHF